MNFEPDLNEDLFYKEGVTQISKYLNNFKNLVTNYLAWSTYKLWFKSFNEVIDIPNIPHKNFMVSDLLNENIIENIPEKSPLTFTL